MPLIAETFPSNIPLLLYSLVYVEFEGVGYACELRSNTSEKLSGMVNISTALGEEKTCSKTVLFMVLAGDGTGDGGLSCPS